MDVVDHGSAQCPRVKRIREVALVVSELVEELDLRVLREQALA